MFEAAPLSALARFPQLKENTMTDDRTTAKPLALLHNQLQDGEYAFFNLEDWVARHTNGLVMEEDLPQVACPVPACHGMLRICSSQYASAKVHRVSCDQPGVIVLSATIELALSINVDLDREDYEARPKRNPRARWRRRPGQHARHPAVQRVNIKTTVLLDVEMTIRGRRCTDHRIAFIDGLYGRIAFRYEPERATEAPCTNESSTDTPTVHYLPKAGATPR